MKKKLFRLMTIMVIVLMVMSLSVSFATENSDPETTPHVPVTDTLDEHSVDIKVGSSGDITILVKDYISSLESDKLTDIKDTSIKGSASSYENSTGTLEITYTKENGDTIIVPVAWKVVVPDTYRLKATLSNLTADSTENNDINSLLNYINSDLILEVSGTDYDKAIGNGQEFRANSFNWAQSNNEYNQFGGVTYTFSQIYKDSVLERTVAVSTVTKPTPSASINYSTSKMNGVSANISWSLDQKSWAACQENMDINGAWYGKTVYFKYPETNHYSESGTQSLYVPIKAERPTGTLKLESTSHSVIITNCWDFDGVEYSIDRENYYKTSNDTYTFNGLKSDTNYTVYTRKAAVNGTNLYSDDITQAISTKKAVINELDIIYNEDSRNLTGTVTGYGTVANSISGTTLKGSYNSSTFDRFKSIVAGYINKKLNTTATLYIGQYIEDNESLNINAIEFSMPLNPLSESIKNAGLTLNYKNDYVTVDVNNSAFRSLTSNQYSGTLNIVARKVNSVSNTSALSFVKSEFNNNRPVYYLSTKVGSNTGSVTYTIPYKLANNETLSGLVIYSVTDSGDKQRLTATYDNISENFVITTNRNGYIVISRENSYSVMPFNDVVSTHWSYNAINYCYNRGIFMGVYSNQFAPETNISRAMIYTLLARISGHDLDKINTDRVVFSDLDKSEWYYTSALWARDNGLVNTATFDGDETMKRADIAVALYNFMKLMGYDVTGVDVNLSDKLYKDLSNQSNEVKTATVFLNQNNIMIGTGINVFGSDTNVTRAQMAMILYRLNEQIITKGLK